jgi:hypothetical protein
MGGSTHSKMCMQSANMHSAYNLQTFNFTLRMLSLLHNKPDGSVRGCAFGSMHSTTCMPICKVHTKNSLAPP